MKKMKKMKGRMKEKKIMFSREYGYGKGWMKNLYKVPSFSISGLRNDPNIDSDGDGVPNKKDCEPFNPMRQDINQVRAASLPTPIQSTRVVQQPQQPQQSKPIAPPTTTVQQQKMSRAGFPSGTQQIYQKVAPTAIQHQDKKLIPYQGRMVPISYVKSVAPVISTNPKENPQRVKPVGYYVSKETGELIQGVVNDKFNSMNNPYYQTQISRGLKEVRIGQSRYIVHPERAANPTNPEINRMVTGPAQQVSEDKVRSTYNNAIVLSRLGKR
jgi:hypothetical protein